MPDINITSTLVEKSFDAVKGFVSKLVGGSIEEAGLIFAEKIRLRRLNNQITILEKAQKIAETRNINIKQINLKVLVPLLKYTSVEEEETLQDMWANLIANYSDASKVYNSTVFPSILNQLSSEEAKFLRDNKNSSIPVHNLGFYPNLLGTGKRIYLDKVEIYNLVRLGLFEMVEGGILSRTKKVYRISKIGYDFIECCNP